MAETFDEAVMRITAQFVAAQEAGEQPRLDEYLRRYPRYAEEIVDFVTYYYALEADLPTVSEEVPQLSSVSRMALDRAWRQRENAASDDSLTRLLLSRLRQFSYVQLASALDLDVDILRHFFYCQLDLATVPQEFWQRLAGVLEQPVELVRRTLEMPEQQQTRSVAEASASYELLPPSLPPGQSFRQVVVASSYLSAPQKERWQKLLDDEGL